MSVINNEGKKLNCIDARLRDIGCMEHLELLEQPAELTGTELAET